MTWYLDLIDQVRRILPVKHGGTGNSAGGAPMTAVRAYVRLAVTVSPGMVVRFDQPNTVLPVADEDSLVAAGVVVGLLDDDGNVDASADAGQGDFVLVALAGLVPVLLAENVTPGEYAFPTDTSGAARGETDPAPGTIGMFVGQGEAGTRAIVKLGGGGGGGGGLGQLEAHFVSPTGGLETRETRIPFGCIVTGWVMRSSAPCTAEADVWVTTLAAAPPTGTDSITGTAPPELVADDRATGSTLTGWTTTLNAGDRLIAAIYPVETDIDWITLDIVVERTS